ncbi:vacuole membrane protein kms1 [Quercus suber]|uniref:Vacuole membrane protein kms1 n=1 Tax=Quercus suber TaxID=58331 RepID=A0AAW0KDB2_QUESU
MITTQPFRTLKFFVLAVIQYIKSSISYLLAKGGWLMLLSTVAIAIGILVVAIDGPHEKHVEEISRYFRFGLWWVALGVASSIGLGSGLHTFVLYLGPHIAFFTIKAMQCGRVDLKSAPYDTIQLERGPSWLDKDCSEFGPPLFQLLDGLRVPLSSILPQVQIEAILWGVGTAIGELPPYFISRAASESGKQLDAASESSKLGAPSSEGKGFIATRLNQIKHWLLSHSQHLNFFTILVLASTIFIISVCNNQLLNWIENELIWILSFIPGFASVLPNVIAKLNAMRDKYLIASAPATSNVKVKKWDFSVATLWNTVVWLMLMNFFVKIVNSTAQSYLKKQQEKELAKQSST